MSDSSGIRMVNNPTEGLWTSESNWTVVEDLRIGVVSGEPAYQFGVISAIDVDPAGNLFVLDSQAQEVRVFHPNGRFVRAVGGPGQGPGEIGSGASNVFVGPGDTLVVVDLQNQRINRYDAEGRSVGSFGPLPAGVAHLRWKLTEDGVLLAQVRTLSLELEGQAVPAGDPIVAFGNGGTLLDTLHVLPPGQSMTIEAGGRPKFTTLAPEPFWDLTPDGSVVSALNSAHRVETHDASGRMTQVMARDVARSPVSDRDRSRMREEFENEMDRRGIPAQVKERFLDVLGFAEYYPAFVGLLVGEDGSVWLQRVRDRAENEIFEIGDALLGAWNLESSDWDVFDDEGRYLGILAFPEHFEPLKVLRDQVYGVWRDELDVQYVMRLRLNRPTP